MREERARPGYRGAHVSFQKLSISLRLWEPPRAIQVALPDPALLHLKRDPTGRFQAVHLSKGGPPKPFASPALPSFSIVRWNFLPNSGLRKAAVRLDKVGQFLPDQFMPALPVAPARAFPFAG